VCTFAHNSKTLHRNVRDISVSNLTVTFNGVPLVEEAELTLNYGNRYGNFKIYSYLTDIPRFIIIPLITNMWFCLVHFNMMLIFINFYFGVNRFHRQEREW
jgi:hypothetical protein